MADLTVLNASNSLYPLTHGLFSQSTPRFSVYQQPYSAPVHSTNRNYDDDEPVQDQMTPEAESETRGEPRRSRGRSSRPRQESDNSFLSPPVNTFKSPQHQRQRAPPQQQRRRHRPTRSQSAPPGPDRRQTRLDTVPEYTEEEDPIPPLTLGGGGGFRSPNTLRPLQPKRSFSSFASIGTTRGGELLPPPPPLLRPTTFWRKTRRSGVTGASYSPSSHLVRRATYIAAGLQFDSPGHDLSALCVESRVGCIVIPPEFTFTTN